MKLMVKTCVKQHKNTNIYNMDTRVACLKKTYSHQQQRTPEWEQRRLHLLTATDIPTILGVNPYSTVDELILRKCGMMPKFEGNVFTQWGNAFEDIAMFNVYKKIFDITTEIVQVGCVEHPVYKFLGASPDFLLSNGKIVEIKCPFKRRVNGMIPDYYFPQVQLQLEVCDLDIVDFFECEFHKLDSNQAVKGFEMISNNISEFVDAPIFGTVMFQNNLMPWYLERCSLTTVYRDKAWFAKNIEVISSFHDNLEKIRTDKDKLAELLYRFNNHKPSKAPSAKEMFINI